MNTQHAKVLKTLQRRADWFMAGQHTEAAAEFTYPFVAYCLNTPIVVGSKDQMKEMLAQIRSAMVQQDLGSIRVQISAMDIARQNRFRVWTHHQSHCRKGHLISKADSIQFCSETSRGIQTQMIQYHDRSFCVAFKEFVEV